MKSLSTAVVLALLLVVVGLVNTVVTYNVLMMMPFASPSHKNVFDPVAEELVRKGHKVTIMAPFQTSKKQPGVTNVCLEGGRDTFERYDISFFQGDEMFAKLGSLVTELCNSTFRDPAVTEILRSPRDSRGEPKFHLVVIDTVFGDFVLPIAHHLGVPVVYLSPNQLFLHLAWALDIPYPLSYVPVGLTYTNRPMTFRERSLNALMGLMSTVQWRWSVMPAQDRVIREVLPNAPPLSQLQRNVSFVLTNTHPALHQAFPRMPYVAEVGGISCKPGKPLPKDLEDFMTSSGAEGVIYFSLGSHTKGGSMPAEMTRKILEVFAQLPQKILWKHEGRVEGLSPNVRLITWAPQQDLLAHPKLRLFITHGGLLSTHEAAYHGCPILGFPLSADQWGNVAHAYHAGFSEFLDWKTFTTQELLDKIRALITDPRYKKRALEMSRVYHDYPQPLAEMAAFWMEYVIRHRGASHLKSNAGHLNLFQYFLLDVIGAALGAVIVAVLLSAWLIRKVLNRCWCPSNKKVKRN